MERLDAWRCSCAICATRQQISFQWKDWMHGVVHVLSVRHVCTSSFLFFFVLRNEGELAVAVWFYLFQLTLKDQIPSHEIPARKPTHSKSMTHHLQTTTWNPWAATSATYTHHLKATHERSLTSLFLSSPRRRAASFGGTWEISLSVCHKKNGIKF